MGATSGIGLHVAELLVAKGWKVGAAGRNTHVLDEMTARFPGSVVTECIDVTRKDAPDGLSRLIGKLGGMDVYFHVAGIGFENEALHITEETDVMQTNVVGFTRMIDAAYRWFRDRNGGYGHIAAITSVAGTNGIGRLAAYSASKACDQTYLRALEQLTRIERLHIRFTDIRPGWVRTPLLADNQNYPMIMQVTKVADEIVRAIERGPRVKVIDWRWNILVGLWRLVPNWLWIRLPLKISSLAPPKQTAANRRMSTEDQEGVS